MIAADSNGFHVARDRTTWTFTINRAERRNALIWPVRHAILDTIKAAEVDPDCRALILTGAGDKAFCAGSDIAVAIDAAAEGQSAADWLQTMRWVTEIQRALVTSRIVTISAVNGTAFGGGCFLALAADIVVAHRSASFGFGFVRRGLVPDWGGFYMLPRLVGLAQAKSLILRGRTIGADEAVRIGLIAETVDTDVVEAARVIAAEIVDGAPLGVSLSKQVLARAFETGLEGNLLLESLAQTIAGQSQDHAEGFSAFLEKRPPVFRGQ